MRSTFIGSALVLAILAGAAMGCGDGRPQNDNGAGPYYPTDQALSGLFRDQLTQATLTCADASDCPESIGMVVVMDGKNDGLIRYGQCSGTLIRGDVVLTNSHCIPDAVKANPSLCSGRLGFVSSFYDRSECAELLYFSDISDSQKQQTQPDYALIRLKKSLTSRPAPVSMEGFKDKQVVTIYVADPTSSYEVSGLIKKKTCVAIQRSAFAPDFTHPLAKVVSLFGDSCDIVPGNSGSGIRNDRGEVVGVISHGRNKSFEAQLRVAFSGLNIPDRLGVGSNLACLDLTRAQFASNPTCASAPSPNSKSRIDEADLKARLTQELLGIVERAPKPFKYKVQPGEMFRVGKEMRQSVMLTPVCVKPSSTWKSEFPIVTESTGFLGLTKEKRLRITHNQEAISITVGYDDYLRMSAAVRSRVESTYFYDLKVDEEEKNYNGNSRTGQILRPTFFPLHLKECSEEQLKTPFEN